MSITSHDSETRAHGEQVITACAFIHHKFNGIEKVFLPKRALTKKFLPGVYELPGGHIDFGEDIVVGLQREIKEELGMDISVGDPFFSFTYFNEIKGSHSVEVDYFATFLNQITEIKLNSEDHTEFGWFTEEEINTKVLRNRNQSDDMEIQAIRKGFSLIFAHKLNFG